MSYNETGQYLATVHEGERAVYTWANKVLFVAHINIRAHPADYLPSWSMISTEEGGTCDIDDDEDDLTTLMDQDIKAMKELQIDENLVTFSGLPSSRWANLPDLALIKERNKPTDAVKKIKQAPFFLSASATLDGFEFETENIGDEMDGDSRYITSKRNLLELESSFTTLLRNAKTRDHLLDAFKTLQNMSLSAIDFQIRTLNPKTIPIFFRMLLEVLKTKTNFELVQAYAATATKIHRTIMWNASEGASEHEELTEVLEEMAQVQMESWNEMENLFVENMAVVQWIKNALL